MATIAGITMLGWEGLLKAAVRRTAALPAKPGYNGHAFVVDAWEAPIQELKTTQEYATDVLAVAAIVTVRALMDGNDKTIVDPKAHSWTAKIISVVGDPVSTVTGTTKVYYAWRVQVTSGP